MDMEDVGTKCRICGNRKGNEIYKCKDRRLNIDWTYLFKTSKTNVTLGI